MTFTFPDTGESVTATVSRDAGAYLVTVTTPESGSECTYENVRVFPSTEAGDFSIEVDGKRETCSVVCDGDTVHLFAGGNQTSLTIEQDAYLKNLDQVQEGSVVTPMPCKISQVLMVCAMLTVHRLW